jgi:hypothetical protein
MLIPKIQIGNTYFGRSWKMYKGLAYFPAFWYTLWPFSKFCSRLVNFFYFGIFVLRKIWQPCPTTKKVFAVVQLSRVFGHLKTKKKCSMLKSRVRKPSTLNKKQKRTHIKSIIHSSIEMFFLKNHIPLRDSNPGVLRVPCATTPEQKTTMSYIVKYCKLGILKSVRILCT